MTSLGTPSTGTGPPPSSNGRDKGHGGGAGGGGGASQPGTRPRRPFWRRRSFLVGGVVAVVLVVAVITDLPQSSTPASKLSDAAATIKEISTDVAACNVGLREAFTIYRKLSAGSLTKSQRSESPSILSDDATGCSYVTPNIVDLASLDLPQVSIGKTLNHVAGRALAWADPDGLTAIHDIAILLAHPHQAKAAKNLRKEIAQLGRDRSAALAERTKLATELGGTLPPLRMRVIRA